MENEIIDCVIGRLQREVGKCLRINSLGSFVNNLSKNKKKFVKRVGFEKLINKHPDKFAIVDEQIYLLESSDIPKHIRNTPQDEHITPVEPISVSKSCKPKEPPESAVLSIIKELEVTKTCMVCAEDKVKFYAYGKCFHPLCFSCCTKLRVLCQDNSCPACRADLTEVVFVSTLRSFSKLDLTKFIQDSLHGIYFETRKVQAATKLLLEHPCNKCNSTFDDFENLKKHMKHKHKEYFCDICVRNLKIFSVHRMTYTSEQLDDHIKEEDEGDGNIKGHPLCRFCQTRYLDRDELFRHLGLNHVTCKLCVDADTIFYADMENLWQHFRQEHYVCEEPDCHLDMNSAFREELDLQAHTVAEHPNMKSKATRKESRRINLTDIASTSHSRAPQRHGVEHHADGSMTCEGKILGRHLFSYYGFITPAYSDELSFQDNIHFNQSMLIGFGDDDNDLRKCFKNGDRVRVRARKETTKTNVKTMWRAISVEKIDPDDPSYHPLEAEPSTGWTSDSNQIDESFDGLDPGSFPALNATQNQATASNPTTTWSHLSASVKTKPTYQSSNTTAAATTTTRVATTAKPKQRYEGCPIEGTGIVHNNIMKDFAFIVWDGAKEFLDNIYFHKAVLEQPSEPFPGNLLKEFKAGDRIGYKLDVQTTLRPGTKSKFRALSVWKLSDNKEDKSKEKAKTGNTPPKEGIGKIHPKITVQHGFIEWEGAKKPEDNIYFNRLSMIKGEGKTEEDIKSLCTYLKPGDKVKYILEASPPQPGMASRYRAWEVKKINSTETAVPKKPAPAVTPVTPKKTVPVASPVTPERIAAPNVKPVTRSNIQTMLENTAPRRAVSEIPYNSPGNHISFGFSNISTDNSKTNHHPVPSLTPSSQGDYSSDNAAIEIYDSEDEDLEEKLNNEISQVTETMIPNSVHSSYVTTPSSGPRSIDLDAIENDVIGNDFSDADSMFAKILRDIFPEPHKVFEAIKRVASPNGSRFGNVLFLKITKTQTIAYVRVPDGSITAAVCDKVGFDESSLGSLLINGSVNMISKEILYVTGSSHYMMLHRATGGSVQSITLHFHK